MQVTDYTFEVLIIEDDLGIIDLIKCQLCNYTGDIIPVFARTLDAAKVALNQRIFDMIFVDGNLEKTGPLPEPETLPLLKTIAPRNMGKLFTISNDHNYQHKMIAHGCIAYVSKESIGEFLIGQLELKKALEPEVSGSYDLTIGSLLVIALLRPEYGDHYQNYIAQITHLSPLTLKVTEEGKLSNLQRGTFRILSVQSRLIQGNVKNQNLLFDTYEFKVKKPLLTGISKFGGKLTDVKSAVKVAS
jgi:hypothetical protein